MEIVFFSHFDGDQEHCIPGLWKVTGKAEAILQRLRRQSSY
jgi:hypothetical protein